LTDHFPEVVETQPELLAHHYTEAGQDEDAIRYWQQAGDRALGQSAYIEGIAYLTKALALLEALPDIISHRHTELDIQLTLCSAFHVTKGRRSPEVGHASLRARELCEQIGDASKQIQVLLRLRRFYMNSGELRTALEYAEEIPRLAQQTQVPLDLFESDFGLGMVLMVMGALRDGQAYLAKSAALADRLGLRGPDFRRGTGADIGLFCRSNDAYARWLLGYPDQARERAHETLLMAQERDHPFTLASILFTVARVYVWCREASVVQERTVWQIALSREHGFTFKQDGMIQNGWALVMQGEEACGLMQMQRGLEGGGLDRYNHPWYLALFAEACRATGKIEAGMRALAQARELVEQSEARWCEAELHRLQGEFFLNAESGMQNVEFTPEACFQKALSIARRQEAKSWELRAATSLARLWQSQGKRQEAYDLLAPVYGWFTEGFDTADLKEAKALLDELS
jgi:predicted ATPase